MIFFLFFFGLAVGSFLNVLIDRLPRDESVVRGRSYCERCKKPLLWYDLVPLVSFLLLRGKCRYCDSPISLYYPVVELVTGVMFVLTYVHLRGAPQAQHHLGGVGVWFRNTSEVAEGLLRGGSLDFLTMGYYLFIVSTLIVVFFTDLKYGIIPDKIVYPGIVISLLYLFIIPNSLFMIHILSAFGAFIFFLLLFLVTRGRGMGFGDVKLVFLLGIFLGFPKVVTALYFAFLTGAAVGCILILWRKKKFRGATLPFGPFLSLGAFIALFWGEDMFLKVVRGLL